MCVTLASTKMSALFFYRRIFCVGQAGQSERIFNVATIISLVIVGCWLVTFDFLEGFQCGTHFSALWDGTWHKYCHLTFPYLYGLTVSNLLLDVWILALPIPLVRPSCALE